MFLGYNTNGFAHHRLADAIEILARLGYRGIALTPDVSHLDLFAPRFREERDAIRARLSHHGLRCVIETGARFILDPWRKHQPTLLSADPEARQSRFGFLADCIFLSGNDGLAADAVSFWSGTPDSDEVPSTLMERLADGCKRLADLAADQGVRLAFEPEPGMFIDTMDKFAELHAKVNHPAFGLTIDIGHLVCNGEVPVSRHLIAWKHLLWNVHIEDMKRGVHDHLMFGEGDVDFPDVFAGLREANYTGGVHVELSRHSYDAVNTARRAKLYLDGFLHSKP
jgi:sugar phosphate isomerase/epimerase